MKTITLSDDDYMLVMTLLSSVRSTEGHTLRERNMIRKAHVLYRKIQRKQK